MLGHAFSFFYSFSPSPKNTKCRFHVLFFKSAMPLASRSDMANTYAIRLLLLTSNQFLLQKPVFVIPAKAGIHSVEQKKPLSKQCTPAFTGITCFPQQELTTYFFTLEHVNTRWRKAHFIGDGAAFLLLPGISIKKASRFAENARLIFYPSCGRKPMPPPDLRPTHSAKSLVRFRFQVRFSGFRFILLTGPSRLYRQWHHPAFVPITAAGPRRNLTVFPIKTLRAAQNRPYSLVNYLIHTSKKTDCQVKF